MRTALTIAGSDSSGGAGIQADIKTMITNGVYAMSAITALTAQNTTGVQAILNVTPEFLGQELDSVFQDTAWDVSSDISVLHTLLAQEGLTDDEASYLQEQYAEAIEES